MKKIITIVLGLLVCATLIIVFAKPMSKAPAKVESTQEVRSVKTILEAELGEKIPISEDDMQKFMESVIKSVQEQDRKGWREKGLHIRNDLKNNTIEQRVYQTLYFKSFVTALSGDKATADKLFLKAEDVQEQPLTMALMDVGNVTTADEEKLQDLRAEVVRLIRGKQETDAAFVAFQKELADKVKAMNSVDAGAYKLVFSVAQKEAFNGSKTFSIKD